jgi:hypothetical protein
LQSGPFVSSGVRSFADFSVLKKYTQFRFDHTIQKKRTGPKRRYIDDHEDENAPRSELRSYYERSESSFDAEMSEFWLGRLSDMIVRRIPKSRSMGRFRTRISVPRFDYISTAGYVRSLFYIVFLPLLALFPSFGLFVFGQMSAAR